MGIEFIRFDMSEYMERHTVSRLIGAPPGYVGFDQGGLLTEAIAKHPHCVLLLDEVEKAHPEVFNLLLQVMDHGTLTDNNGRKADFRHVIIVMTTNAGAFEMNRSSIGFVQSDNATDGAEAIKRLFSPEFRNRIDAIIQFAPLDMPVIERVVDKLLLEIEAQLEKKGVSIMLDDAARRWLAEKGYDPKMGARPMARLMQEQIKRPLAEELLFGKLAAGGTVKIGVSSDGKELKLDDVAGRDAGAARDTAVALPHTRKTPPKRRSVMREFHSGATGTQMSQLKRAGLRVVASIERVVLEERTRVELQSALRQPVAQQRFPGRADFRAGAFECQRGVFAAGNHLALRIAASTLRLQ